MGRQDDYPLLRLLVVVDQHGVSVEGLYEGLYEGLREGSSWSSARDEGALGVGFSAALVLLRARLKEAGLGRWRRAASEAPRLTEFRIWDGSWYHTQMSNDVSLLSAKEQLFDTGDASFAVI